MKKIMTMLLIGLFMISFASAFDFDNVKSEKTTTWDGKTIVGNPLLERYKPIEIKNAFGLGEILFEGYLSQHDNTCGIDCKSTIEINLHQDGILIDEVVYKTLQKDGSWIEQDIRSFQFRYWGQIDDYDYTCEVIGQYENETDILECINTKNGSHEGWINYNIKEEVKAGIYTLEHTAKKKPSRTIDWIIKTNGETLTEWATWGNISLGDDAEVLLNSPADDFLAPTSIVAFNCSVNITGGATLKNMSVYTNESGVWAAKNTTLFDIESSGLISYYKFDGATGTNALDSVGVNNGTISGVTRNVTGIINKSFDFESQDPDFVDLNNAVLPTGASDDFTISAWINPESSNGSELSIVNQNSGGAGRLILNLDGTRHVRIFIGGTSFTSSSQVSLATWAYITVKREGTNVSLWIDNAHIGSMSKGDGIDNTDTEIGRGSTSGNYFDGLIDEVGFWNRSLTDAEVTDIYNAGSAARPGFPTTSTQTWNRTILSTSLWTCQACDSDGDCGFATTNRTVLVDTTAPLIDVETPNGTLNFNAIGSNETLNVTFTDLGLDECWFNYNGTNITIPGCETGVKNSTNFLLEANNKNMTIYANDTLGNSGSEFIEWEYTLLEVNQTFEPTTVETALETYSINLTYDSTNWSSISVLLNYNGTETAGVVLGTGDDVSGVVETFVEPISAPVNKSFYWVISLTNTTGTFDFNSSTQQQYVAQIDFSSCNYSESPQLFFETFSTLSPDTIVNATFASAWTLQSTDGSGVIITRSFEDLTETNSTWGFCIQPNSTTYTVSVAVTVDAVNYTPTTHYIVDTDYSGVGENISLYLLHDDFATLTEIKVTTQDNTPVGDVYTTIQRYDVGTDTYYNVAMTKSDNDGTDLVYLAWYDYWYRFIGVLDGETVFTEGAKKVSESPQIFKTGEIEDLDYEKFGDILYSLIYNNDTENFVLTYVDPTGLTSSNCLRVIKRNLTADYNICETCQASSSATIYCNIASAGNGTFIASYYATGSPAYWIDQLYELKNIQNALFEEIGNDNGTGLAILVAGVVVSLFLVTPALGVLGAILGMVLGIALGFQPLDYTAFIGIVFMGGMIMWAVQK